MINFEFRAPQPELTGEQVRILQTKEALLGRIIYYSPYRDELRHYIFSFSQRMDFPFEELLRVLDERIRFVNDYRGKSRAKRVLEHDEVSSREDYDNEVVKRPFTGYHQQFGVRYGSSSSSSFPSSEIPRQRDCGHPFAPDREDDQDDLAKRVYSRFSGWPR